MGILGSREGSSISHDFYIIDVAGARSQVSESRSSRSYGFLIIPQRHSWIPFFDDGIFHCVNSAIGFEAQRITAQCILFLAPLSFNETLEEDRKVNKIVSRRVLLDRLTLVLTIHDLSGGQLPALEGNMPKQTFGRHSYYSLPQQGMSILNDHPARSLIVPTERYVIGDPRFWGSSKGFRTNV